MTDFSKWPNFFTEGKPLFQPKKEPMPEPVINRSKLLKEGQYIKEVTKKTGIVLHHTVGGTAQSSIDYWNSNAERVGTAYIIDRDGTIFEVFDPKYWSFHLGLKGTNGSVDKRTIGIELASEGGLVQVEGQVKRFYNAKTGGLVHKDEYIDLGQPWRGYRFYDKYEDAQINAMLALLDKLCRDFSITRAMPDDPRVFDSKWTKLEGVFSHSHVRQDKSDLHPGQPDIWQRMITELNFEPIPEP